MDLHIYTLEELKPHLSTLYVKPDAHVPVSPLRLESYLKNPRAQASDPVLFEMRQEGKVIAYRTLLPDLFYDKKNQPQRFAWLSGNWVRPDKRRQGISTRLLEKAEELWEDRLFYTNYAPESKALYDHTGRYRRIASREGYRFYLRSAGEDLLGKRLGFRKIFGSGDQMINQIREQKIQRYKFPRVLPCHIKQVDGFVAQLSELVSMLQQENLFRRDREIFEWALQYPWVTELTLDTVNYHFSYLANHFKNTIYHSIHPDSDSEGILWLLQHNDVLSVPYLFAGNEAHHRCMAYTVVRTMIENGCTHTTIRNPELFKKLLFYKKLFLAIRKMPQQVFAHEAVAGLIPDNPHIHDGDGDVMFTG